MHVRRHVRFPIGWHVHSPVPMGTRISCLIEREEVGVGGQERAKVNWERL